MIKSNTQSGFALVVSILLVAVILSIALSLSAIFIPKIRIAAEAKNSVTAAYAAESALEWCLYSNRIEPVPSPTMTNGSTFTITDCSVSPVKATGTYRGVTRAFEISF
ncbi:MAG: type II secretion system protein [Patescibacteria group bacterium]